MSAGLVTSSSVVAGDDAALIGPRVQAVVARQVEAPLVHACLNAILAGGGLEDVLEVLLSGGLRAAPAFAVCEPLGDERWRVAVRGDVHVQAGGEPERTIRCQGVLVDTEVTHAPSLVLRTRSAPGHGPAVAVGLGAHRAALVLADTRPPALEPAPALVSPQPATGRSPWAALADDTVASGYDAFFAAPPGPASPESVAPRAPGSGFIEDVPDFVRMGAPALPAAPQVPAQAVAAAQSAMPVVPVDLPVVAVDLPVVPVDLPVVPVAPPVAPPATPPVVAPVVAPVAPPPVDDVSRTVNRAELRGDQGVPTVLAVLCPQHHLNPAFATTCRICGAAVAQQTAFETPRPPLGRLVVAGTTRVTLDRDVVLGRNPRVPDGYRGPVLPHLVQLDDPRQEVSGQHAMVSLRSWHVSLTDLGSTNGTEIVALDGSRQRLVPGSAVVIEPGTTVVLAEVLDVRFEPGA